jgi:hypothetical protein
MCVYKKLPPQYDINILERVSRCAPNQQAEATSYDSVSAFSGVFLSESPRPCILLGFRPRDGRGSFLRGSSPLQIFKCIIGASLLKIVDCF